MASNYKILGINDEQHTCERCGKQGLKRVVWLENIDTGAITFVGTDCAAAMLLGRKTRDNAAKIEKGAAAISKARELALSGMSAVEARATLIALHGIKPQLADNHLIFNTIGQVVVFAK